MDLSEASRGVVRVRGRRRDDLGFCALLCQRNDLISKARPLFEDGEGNRGNDNLQERVELVRVRESENPAMAHGDDGCHSEDVEV